MQDRFLTEFGNQDAMEGEADADGASGQAKGGNTEPAEHQAVFAGNTDDHFRLGIKITRWSQAHVHAHACLAAARLGRLSEQLRPVIASSPRA